MIAVAPHHVAHVALRPFVEVLAVAVRDFRNAPHVEGFVHDQQAQPVGELEQFGRGRVVAGADRVDARALHDLQLSLGGAPIDGGTQRAEVVVQADAMEFHALAVEQEARCRSKAMLRMPNGVT